METPKLPSKPKISAKTKGIILVCFFCLGMINNLGYCLIITCSQQFSASLQNESLIALYPLALILFSSCARIINSKYCLKSPYTKRMGFLAIYFFFGFILLFLILQTHHLLGKTSAFILSLIPSLIMGTGSAFGEATVLGYLRLFPDGYVVGWSSGTGLAGVSGAFITLFAKKKNVSSKYLYLFASPLCIIYFCAFYTTWKLKGKIDKDARDIVNDINKKKENEGQGNFLKLDEEVGNDINEKEDYYVEMQTKSDQKDNDNKTDNNTNKQLSVGTIETDNVKLNKTMSLNNFYYGLIKGKRYILNLAAVYFLEYIILYGFCERISKKSEVKSEFFANIVK